jgi:glutaminase
MAGEEYIGFNNSVFLSERHNCDRNSALAHFLAENKCMPPGVDIKKTMDLYTQVSTYYMTQQVGWITVKKSKTFSEFLEFLVISLGYCL